MMFVVYDCRMMEMAVDHREYRLLQRSLRSWHKLTRQAKSERAQEADQKAYQVKMAALLQAATAKAKKQRYVTASVLSLGQSLGQFYDGVKVSSRHAV